MKAIRIVLFTLFGLLVAMVVIQQSTVKSEEHVAGVYQVDEIGYLSATYLADSSGQTSGVIILDSVEFKATHDTDTVTQGSFPGIKLKLVSGNSQCLVTRVIRNHRSFFENRADTVGLLSLPLDVFNRVNQAR
ncbi:MAG: hypothetical protein WC544_05030 [Patescibacteria group bacterium]